MFLDNVDFGSLTAISVSLLVSYTISLYVYRLYFSPISKFPGPWYAAISLWYEFYWDVVQRGRYTWKIEELHRRYGPIIRINPYELHINDPDFYEELYVAPTKRRSNKFWLPVQALGAADSSFNTIDHDLHRARRAAIAPFFSKQNIRSLESRLQSKVDELCLRFEDAKSKGDIIPLNHAYSALTGDIITGYCFPASYDLLSRPEYAADLHNAYMTLGETAHINSQFGWIVPLMEALPFWLVEFFNPLVAGIVALNNTWARQIQAIKSKRSNGEVEDDASRDGIFDELLNSDQPENENSVDRLRQEAQALLGGGFVTTTQVLTLSTFHLISNRDTLQKLMDELTRAIPDMAHPPPESELEKLPYLTATWYESLRMAHGVCHRLARIAPDQSIRFREWIIPPGTPVGMSSIHIHNNSDIFPDPYSFKPERWLPLETEGKRLQSYLVAFGKGSRSCIGMNLAYAEFLLGLSNVFRKFGDHIELVDTVRERDVDPTHDFVFPVTKKETKGVKILITKERQAK